MYGSMKTSRTAEVKERRLTIHMRRKLAFTFIMVAAVLFALAVYLLVLMRNNGKEYQQRILSQQGYDTSLLASGAAISRTGTARFSPTVKKSTI